MHSDTDAKLVGSHRESDAASLVGSVLASAHTRIVHRTLSVLQQCKIVQRQKNRNNSTVHQRSRFFFSLLGGERVGRGAGRTTPESFLIYPMPSSALSTPHAAGTLCSPKLLAIQHQDSYWGQFASALRLRAWAWWGAGWSLILQSFLPATFGSYCEPAQPEKGCEQLGLISVSLTLQMETGRSKSNNYKL